MRTSLLIYLALIVILTTLLSSCTAYQYSTLSSDLPTSQFNDFFYENDTLQIVYSFAGKGALMTIDIFNKLDKPIFINWNQSSVVVNGITTSLNSQVWGAGDLSGLTEEYIDGDGTFTSSTTINNLTSARANSNEYIPTKSQFSIYYDLGQNQFLKTISKDSTLRTNVILANSEPLTIKEHLFIRETSPFKFRCIITYSDDIDANNKYCASNEFWVSSIFRTTSGNVKNREDTFYNSKTTDFGNFMTGVATVAVITGYVLLKVAEISAAQK
ncbi:MULTISPECIES: hypothetical protein [unclassified Saccharicrinis]|uniref:hypothetical protein n=1 Tax=unclassified Saccharicrinis TaxID=2646859 RepID=UPI003D357CDC